MALVVADRIQETTTTTGTGTYTLAGAKTGFASFSGIGDGNTTYYACIAGTDFEVGIGTYTASGTTLARTTILASTNSNNAVDWSAGSKDIFVTLPAGKSVFEDASGNVGLGTSAPSALLHLESAGPNIKLVDNDNDPDYEIKNGNGTFRIIDTTNSEDRLNIDSNGNLLVGKTSTDISVSGSRIGSFGAIFTRSGNESLRLNRTSSDGDVVKFDNDGSTIGSIGVLASDLIIDGTTNHSGLRFQGAQIRPRYNGASSDAAVDIGSSAGRFKDLYLSGTANALQFTATSDLAKKENLEVVEDALNKVQSLTGYTYDIKENGSRKAGLIAQDVEKVLPEAVNGDEGDKTLDYSATIALLVNAIKEQQAQIKELKQKIESI